VPGYLLSPEAEQDLLEIRAYYLTQANARVARYVMGEIASAFRLLAATPGAGHVRPDLTSEPVKFWSVFSYLIVYDPAMQPIGIARVCHGSQDLATLFRREPPRVE
jgi:toxin ParE1/3/4